ncbi:MAG: hypothetical protein SNJ70_06190, partial [Armatimonadota bacterium]
NKDALGKVDKDYSQLYEFKSADIAIKMPDKIKVDGRLGMVKFEYIINGGEKIVRSPTLKINRRDDYSTQPAKLQYAFDFGIITTSLWQNRSMEIIDDEAAAENCEIKVLLKWPTGDMKYYAYIDRENLWLKKFEKKDAQDNLRVRIVYSEPENLNDIIWVPTKIEMYAYDGSLAGISKISGFNINSGIDNSFFE